MNKTILIILDGWGMGDGSKSDAIANANVPFYKSLLKQYPHNTLLTHGENVGLPAGQMGNSEVGHLNIGAGRIVYQDLQLINKAIEDKSIDNNHALIAAFDHAKKNNCALHFMGLVSDGGVHSHENHLFHLCKLASDHGLKKVFIHAFTDGRDTDPKSGLNSIKKIQSYINSLPSGESRGGIEIASIIGRYYAMDRDKRWERVKYAYDLLVHGKGEKYEDAAEAIQHSYNNNATDEFIKPIVLVDDNNDPVATIKDNDVVLCFNFRTDRCREITQALTQQAFPEQGMKPLNLHYVTMTIYDKTYKNVNVIFGKNNLDMTLGEVLEKAGKTQLRMAETEKYPHVTFFFSGGREKEFNGERRIVVPSPKVATYDLQPEMSAVEVAKAAVNEINSLSPDFICLNFANPDMVGHTGVYPAVVKALETVDKCLNDVVMAAIQNNYSIIIIADHGNADYMLNPDGSPNTAHSMNLVPVILIDKHHHQIQPGKLSDIAPTILELMNIPKPAEMEGKSLL